MSVETLTFPRTISIPSQRRVAPNVAEAPRVDEPNWGREDMHAIKAIAYIMNGIFLAALVMYATITIMAM